MDNSSRNHALQQCLMHTRALTTIYTPQFLFPKVAIPSQCASLWRDVRHALVRWLCWQMCRTFQACNTLWHLVSWVAIFLQNVTNLFVFHLTQIFPPATQGTSYNLTKSPTAKSITRMLQLSEVWLKTWRRFFCDGNCPLDGTCCQRNNCLSPYKGKLR